MTFLLSIDYPATSLGINQMGKESKYTFTKFSSAKNYKKWAKEMIFALKDLGLWRYVNGTIMKPAPLLVKEKTTAKAKQKTQNKIDFWTKENTYALRKID